MAAMDLCCFRGLDGSKDFECIGPPVDRDVCRGDAECFELCYGGTKARHDGWLAVVEECFFDYSYGDGLRVEIALRVWGTFRSGLEQLA
jgi:hypothetical protein